MTKMRGPMEQVVQALGGAISAAGVDLKGAFIAQDLHLEAQREAGQAHIASQRQFVRQISLETQSMLQELTARFGMPEVIVAGPDVAAKAVLTSLRDEHQARATAGSATIWHTALTQQQSKPQADAAHGNG